MSDLCTYKIEDRVWDEYCETDDHIVPQTGDKRSHRISFHSNGCEKPPYGVSHISSNFKERYSDEYVDLEREQRAYSRRRTMLENDSLFPTQQSLFPDRNSIRYAPGSISDNPKTSGHYFSNNNADSIGTTCSSNDAMHDEKSTADHGHSYSYPLGATPQIDSDLNFFDNFEDVDLMFSCDSTFGLGASSDDEFGWFSSPNAQGGPRDSPKSDLKFPCPEPNAICSINNAASATPVKPNENSLHLCRDEFDSPLSIGNGPSSSDNTDEVTVNDEIDEDKMHSKNQNPSERERKEQYFGNGSSFSYFSLTSEVIQCPYEDASSPAFQNVDIRHQQPDLGQDPYGLTRDALDCDNISPEAVRIRQLQHVTEQLDSTTKLCIRDSLYRLAKAAEQRQNLENLNSNRGDETDGSETFMAEAANKFTGSMNVNTDTNSVDRSIARLLFLSP